MGSLELQEEVSKAAANSQEKERAVKLQMQQGGLWSYLRPNLQSRDLGHLRVKEEEKLELAETLQYETSPIAHQIAS